MVLYFSVGSFPLKVKSFVAKGFKTSVIGTLFDVGDVMGAGDDMKKFYLSTKK